MFELIKEFPAQLLAAINIGQNTSLKTKFTLPIRNVVVSGLGGSGIGGNFLSELLREELTIPVVVNKSYFLPAFVDSSTLLILSSYSGNTEETISCAEQAVEKGLQPIIVTSGGKLEEIALKHKLDLIKIPAGFPPRACLAYSATQLFFILKHYGLISDAFIAAFTRSAAFLEGEQKAIMADAELLAAKLLKKVIIVYTEDKYESTALRLKQQINENSKLHCWHNVIPEMNHNELVGWREPNEALAVLILRSCDEYSRNTSRILFEKDVIEKISDNVYEIDAKGGDTFERHFFLIHFGDWLSFYLATQQGYDPSEINVLLKLKSHMSSIK
ncbi:MAG: bifunctional phosphoglucose/phosphomannose isomerase [Bacteroidota bacterium]